MFFTGLVFNENFPICVRNAKGKNPLANKTPLPFHRKWRGELMYLLDPSGLTGLEPATSALTGRCSCLLNYNPREIRRDLAEILDSFLFSRIRYFLRTRVFYHLIVDWQIVGPSWIWTSVDILPTNLQSVPINRSGIDPGRISFRLIGNPR